MTDTPVRPLSAVPGFGIAQLREEKPAAVAEIINWYRSGRFLSMSSLSWPRRSITRRYTAIASAVWPEFSSCSA